jgi:hypothetical protein
VHWNGRSSVQLTLFENSAQLVTTSGTDTPFPEINSCYHVTWMLLTIHANKSKRGIPRVPNNYYRVLFGTVKDPVKHLPFTVDTNCCEKRWPFPVRFNSDFWRDITAKSFSNVLITRRKTACHKNVNQFASSLSDHILFTTTSKLEKIVFEIVQRISS